MGMKDSIFMCDWLHGREFKPNSLDSLNKLFIMQSMLIVIMLLLHYK